MNKIFILLFIGLMLVSLGSATTEIPAWQGVQIGDPAILTQNCVGSTYANITKITYPNQSIALSGETAMIKNGNDYSYQFNNTNVVGKYYVYGHCDENGIDVNWAATQPVGNQGFGLLIIIGIAAILMFLFGYFQHNIWFVYISGILFMILGVYILINGFTGTKDTYTDALGYVSIGLSIILFVVASYEQLAGEGESSDD